MSNRPDAASQNAPPAASPVREEELREAPLPGTPLPEARPATRRTASTTSPTRFDSLDSTAEAPPSSWLESRNRGAAADEHVTEKPVAENPVTQTPSFDTPSFDTPSFDAPSFDAPSFDGRVASVRENESASEAIDDLPAPPRFSSRLSRLHAVSDEAPSHVADATKSGAPTDAAQPDAVEFTEVRADKAQREDEAQHEDVAWPALQSGLPDILSRESQRRERRRQRARRVLRQRMRRRVQQRWPWLGGWLWTLWAGLEAREPRRWPKPVVGWIRARHWLSSLLDNSLTAPNIFSARLARMQRESAYQAELLDLFRLRVRLVAALGMAVQPLFVLLYLALTPRANSTVVLVYVALFVLCAQTRSMARRMTALSSMRRLSLAAYALFSAGAGVIVAQAGAGHVFIMGGHNHIMLTVLLLPYSVWECAAVGAIALASLAWAGWHALMPGQSALYFSHLFMLGTTTLFVLCIAHLHSVLHRRAFNAAFDLLRSATRLQTLSFLDTLTGGFNRRYLEKMLGIEIARAARFARPLSVMMFDLDNFKMVNDTRGHAAGDVVLREVWEATLGAVREVDTAARYGGDEFAVVLPESDEAAARVIAERLQSATRTHLHHRFGAASREGQVTLSIGIITARLHQPVSSQTLLARADERLYAAKRNGKNRIAD